MPLRLQSAFVAAKAAVVNLTKSMALELGPSGDSASTASPPARRSPRGRSNSSTVPTERSTRDVQQMLDHVPLGRPGTTDEIAVAALFLADPENSYMNGHMLVVDGGWIAGYHRQF